MILSFSPLTKSAAREIVTWRYEPPYDIYNLDNTEETLSYLCNEQNNYYAMRDETNGLVGFCSFGADGQVPGGDYAAKALDIGMGVRPDLTGRGHGGNFVTSVLDFARQKFNPTAFRVTIATFNQRAQRVWEKNGFIPIETSTFTANNRDFMIMQKEV